METFLTDVVGPVDPIMDLRIRRYILLVLKKYANTVLIIRTVPLILFLLYLLVLPLLTAFTTSLCKFYFYKFIGKPAGVEQSQHNQDLFCFRRTPFYSQIKSKVDNILTKSTVLRININNDDAPISSHTHTHPSQSQTSRIFSTSLSLGIPFLRSTSVREAFTFSSFSS